MKTTIKLSGGRALVIQPAPQGVALEIMVGSIKLAGQVITPEQAAGAIHALETALGCGGSGGECVHPDSTAGELRAAAGDEPGAVRCHRCPARRRA